MRGEEAGLERIPTEGTGEAGNRHRCVTQRWQLVGRVLVGRALGLLEPRRVRSERAVAVSSWDWPEPLGAVQFRAGHD